MTHECPICLKAFRWRWRPRMRSHYLRRHHYEAPSIYGGIPPLPR